MHKLFLSFIAVILFPSSKCTVTKDFKHLGCYKEDYFDKALPKFLGYIKKVEECAVLAENSGFTTFGVQLYPMYGTECYSGPKAHKTYDKYGTSKACSNGLGGDDLNDVYQFTDEFPLWPGGLYSMMKPQSGCPAEWSENGYVFQGTYPSQTNNKSTSYHVKGHIAETYVIRTFCSKNQLSSPKWPEGQYCVYNEGTTNQDNKKTGWYKMYNDKAFSGLKSKTGVYVFSSTPTIKTSVYCETTGDKSAPIDLPISHPFYLLPYGSSGCQQVKWMVAAKEWVQYATDNYNGYAWSFGKNPFITVGSKDRPGLTENYCYYESCNKTLNATHGVFKTPGFPGYYPNGQLCSWMILVPVNHTLLVKFTHFFLDDTLDNDKDVLEFYNLINGGFRLNRTYAGHHKHIFMLTSKSDVMFVFRSNNENSSVGFRAEYSMFTSQGRTTKTPIVLHSNEPTTQPIATTTTTTTTQPTTQPLTLEQTTLPTQTTTGTKTDHTAITMSNPTKGDSTTDQSTKIQTTIGPAEKINQTGVAALKDRNQRNDATIILTVIPLFCCVLIAVVLLDIYYRWRTNSKRKDGQEQRRNDEQFEQVATNPTYGRTEEFPMSYYSSTVTTNRETTNHYEDTTLPNYESFSRFAPRREEPEEYQELNKASFPSPTQKCASLDEIGHDNPHYQSFDEYSSNCEVVTDNEMYNSIECNSCTDNVLYESSSIFYDK